MSGESDAARDVIAAAWYDGSCLRPLDDDATIQAYAADRTRDAK